MPARTYVFVPLVVTSVALLAGATYIATAHSARPGSAQPEVRDPAPVAECVARLSQVGLTPESLAAASVSTESASGVLAAGIAYLTLQRRADLRTLEAQISAVARRPTSGNLAELKQAKAAAMEELFAFASSPLSGEQRLVLQQIHANKHWPVPLEYRTQARTEAEWIGLRDSLAAARAHGGGESAVPFSNELAVTNARAGLDNAEAIKQAWNMAMQP